MLVRFWNIIFTTRNIYNYIQVRHNLLCNVMSFVKERIKASCEQTMFVQEWECGHGRMNQRGWFGLIVIALVGWLSVLANTGLSRWALRIKYYVRINIIIFHNQIDTTYPIQGIACLANTLGSRKLYFVIMVCIRASGYRIPNSSDSSHIIYGIDRFFFFFLQPNSQILEKDCFQRPQLVHLSQMNDMC